MVSRITRQVKKYRFLTFALLFIVIAFFATYGSMKATSTNEFCSSCHSMGPQYYTFEASSHSGIDCVSCHIEPGFVNYVEAKMFGLVELYVTVTNSENPIIHSPESVSNAACERCHTMENREETTSGDLIFDHTVHNEENVSCVTCHDGVAHGKVVEQGAAYKTDWERWTADLGRYIMDGPLVSPQKKVCMDCHELKNAPTDCASCHSTGQYPESHEDPDFITEHGKFDIQECLYCHGWMDNDPALERFQDTAKHYEIYLSGGKNIQAIDVNDYAKNNQFCTDCHNIRPESHNVTAFFQLHGENFESESANCLTCHEMRPTDNRKLNNNIYCSTCHSNTHGDAFKIKHPFDVSDATTVDPSCLTCHVEEKCLSCHLSPLEKQDREEEDSINGREEKYEDDE